MLSDEERDALNRGGVRGVIESRAEVTDSRLAALESHVTPIPRMEGGIEKLQTDIKYLYAALKVYAVAAPRIERSVEGIQKKCAQTADRISEAERHTESIGDMWGRITSLEQRVSQIDARLGVEEVWRRDAIFPTCARDAPDLLSFLTHCDGALDCSPDGEIRLIFPEGAPVPLSDLMTAASILRAHDPEGPIGVAYDGGIVVLLRPAPKEGRA